MNGVPRDAPHRPLRQMFRERIHGDDAADVNGFLDVVFRHFKFRMLENRLTLVPAHPAEHDQRVADLELVRQVLRAEPAASDEAGIVFQDHFVEGSSEARPHEPAGHDDALDARSFAAMQGRHFLEMAPVIVPARKGQQKIADIANVESLQLFGANLAHPLEIADGRRKSFAVFHIGHDGHDT